MYANKYWGDFMIVREKYLKTIAAHVGVAITKNKKIYIEDSYVK